MDLPDARHAGERRWRDLLPESGGVAGGALLGSSRVSSKLARLAVELLFARLADDQCPPQVAGLPVEPVACGSGEIAS
jgi:hypothetical protein